MNARDKDYTQTSIARLLHGTYIHRKFVRLVCMCVFWFQNAFPLSHTGEQRVLRLFFFFFFNFFTQNKHLDRGRNIVVLYNTTVFVCWMKKIKYLKTFITVVVFPRPNDTHLWYLYHSRPREAEKANLL